MSENPPLEAVESFDLTDQDEADIAALMREPEAEYHTVLEAWREVLVPSVKLSSRKPTPFECARITSQYPAIKMQEMQIFHEIFYDKLEQIKQILNDEINLDDKCLTYGDAKTDREENSHHYKNVLLNWQLQALTWELEWECTHEHSHIEIAAMVEIHKMVLSQDGLVAHLDSIAMEFTEEDQKSVHTALENLRGEHE